MKGSKGNSVSKRKAPKADAPSADAPKADAPKAEVPKADAPSADAPNAETPKADVPSAETPKADVSSADAPKADAPSAELPKADAPKADAPNADAPKADAPSTEAPKAETLKAETPAAEAFGELPSTLAADADAEARYRGAVDDSSLLSSGIPVARKILLTGLTLGALVAIPYSTPLLAPMRLLSPNAAAVPAEPSEAAAPLPTASVGEAKVPGRTDDQQQRGKELDLPAQDSRGPIAHGAKDDDAPAASVLKSDKPPRTIDDPSGRALDHFFAKLERVERKEPGAIARILYYGDSIVASDFVSGKLRRLLQDRFGDAGHGYSLIANAWPGWFHIDVSRKASSEWAVSTCVGPYAEDGYYGLGCASFVSHHHGIWARFATADVDTWGRNVGRFELEYLAQPGGGAVDLFVDDQPRGRLETEAPAPELRWHTVEVPDGPHSYELRSVDGRPVRLFGVRMERDVPGVTLSALGITGARARFLDKQDDEHWKQALRGAKPDLVVLAFGSNEITDASKYPLDEYEKTLVAVMQQVRAAVPDASVMLVGPPDMASNNPAQGYSRPYVFFVTKRQKEIAAKQGWAYWDQFNAMGGGGSMWSWMKAGLGSQDMFHPTGQGGSVLGKWEYQAIIEAYDRYRGRAAGAGN